MNFVKLLKSFFHRFTASSFNLQTRRRFTCVSVCFSSGVTGLLHLDESGDRETDFALWDIVDTNSTTFQVNTLNTDTLSGTFGVKGLLSVALSETLMRTQRLEITSNKNQ